MRNLLLTLSPNKGAAGTACSTPWLNHGWLGCSPVPELRATSAMVIPRRTAIDRLPLPVHRVSPHAGMMCTVRAHYKVP